MLRLLVLAAVFFLLFRLISGRWPLRYLRPGSAGDRQKLFRQQEIARARAVLGVDSHANRQQILDAHRRMMLRLHPDRGGDEAAARQVNAARDILLNTPGEPGASPSAREVREERKPNP